MNAYPDVPGHRGVETSMEAADEIATDCARLQSMALAAIRGAGSSGLTADELAAKLDMNRWSIQPRTSELRAKRLIGDSGQRRRNCTGKRAIVWVAREYLCETEQAA